MGALAGIDAKRAALLLLILAAAAIAAAWVFEAFGYLPCELCLKQRIAYYAGVPLAALVAAITLRGEGSPARGVLAAGFIGVALIFAASALLGVYHSGVEWGFWPGPAECTGDFRAAPGGNLLEQLKTVKVVRCDAVAIRIIGLSLAGWNAVVSAALVALAVIGARRAASEL